MCLEHSTAQHSSAFQSHLYSFRNESYCWLYFLAHCAVQYVFKERNRHFVANLIWKSMPNFWLSLFHCLLFNEMQLTISVFSPFFLRCIQMYSNDFDEIYLILSIPRDGMMPQPIQFLSFIYITKECLFSFGFAILFSFSVEIVDFSLIF